MIKRNKTILVADDDPGIVDVLTLILEDAGYKIKSTLSGHSVVNLKQDLPDLILLDIWLAGMDGGNICKFLKSQKKTNHIPIVMISANKDTEEIALAAGANDFIKKPFEMADLLSRVEKFTS